MDRELGATHRPGDVPQSLARRYFTETLRGGAAVAFYEGPGAKRIAFHDHGAKLATDQSHPVLLRDFAAIAAHRGWRVIEVKGTDEFRRQMWLEARALGLDVKGYKPGERDRQELDRRGGASPQDRSGPSDTPAGPASERANGEPELRKRAPARPDFDAGVVGTLTATGEAPYRRRRGEPSTPFIRIDRGDGRTLDVWGVGLPDALQRSGAKVGDVVQVRRDGVEVVPHIVAGRDPATGAPSRRLRDVSRNRWVIEADRFRRTSDADAARDARLSGAQSHLAVLNTVIDGAIKDPEGRARLRAEAREMVAGELAQGRRFTLARIREVEPVLARDLTKASAREATSERLQRR